MKGMAYTGWNNGLPDKFWPVTLDNFFDNPDEIREVGLRSLATGKVFRSSDEEGQWPGQRSDHLWKIDEKLSQRMCEKILSCYFNLDFEKIFWNSFETQFQLIPRLSKDKNNSKNKGWIHTDGVDARKNHHPDQEEQPQLSGLIYLTPDIERDTGTSLFNMKKDKTLQDWDETIEIRKKIHLGDPAVSDEEVKELWQKHRNCFIEKVRFENIYNRLIMYDTKEWHGPNSLYTPKDNRLTLVFFIRGILANKWPMQRLQPISLQ